MICLSFMDILKCFVTEKQYPVLVKKTESADTNKLPASSTTQRIHRAPSAKLLKIHQSLSLYFLHNIIFIFVYTVISYKHCRLQTGRLAPADSNNTVICYSSAYRQITEEGFMFFTKLYRKIEVILSRALFVR